MFRRLRLVLLLVLVTAVFVITTQVVSTQEAPPRPSRTIEEMPRLPGAEVKPNDTEHPSDTEATDTVAWGKRTFQSYRDGNWEIYTQNSDSIVATRLTSHGAVDMHPRLNRGATRIVFASKRGGSYEIYTMNVDGSDVTRLTFTNSDNVYPSWSLDGTKITFQSYRDGQAEIYIMNADGSGQTRLTTDPGFDGYPAWSPDSTRIAFSSSRSGQAYIYVMNANGTGVTQLSNQIYSYNPVWSPDGSQIAYDADLDNDGWQELWVMNADGTNPLMKYDPPGQVDAWVHSWSPDGYQIAYTYISFIYYQGVWYWVDAYLDVFRVQQHDNQRLNYGGLDWNPDLQTIDTIPPVSTLNPLPPQVSYKFLLTWSGQDVGVAGLESYEMRYKIGPDGPWIDSEATLPSYYSFYEYNEGIGGQMHYFQIRARDYAGNFEAWDDNNIVFTTVENYPPQTTVTPLNPFTRLGKPISLQWTGGDIGGSGIAAYDLQYRIDNGNWVYWDTLSSDVGNTINWEEAVAGQTYAFQVRGVDYAQNQEPWTGGEGDTRTTVYSTAIAGNVQDNSGTPIQGITLTTNPASFYVVNGDDNGRYASYLATQAPSYTAQWSKNGYGPLPPTTFTTKFDTQTPIVLPPADNVIRNSGFEPDAFDQNWILGGSVPARITNILQHTGQYAALLGVGNEFFNGGEFVHNSNTEVQTAIDGNQTVHAAWIYLDSLVYTQRLNGEWLPIQTVATNLQSSNICLVIDNLNTVHLVWQTSAGIQYAQKPNGGNWSTPQIVYSLSTYLITLQIGVGDDGIVHLIWQASGDLFYQQHTDDGTWTIPEPVYHDTSMNTPSLSKLIVDEQGTSHLVSASFANTAPPYFAIFYVQRPAGGNWSEPLNLSESLNNDTYHSDYAVEPNGTVHVVMCTANNNMYYTQRLPNGSWTQLDGFETGHSNCQMNLTLDREQTIHLVFGPEHDTYYMKRDNNGVWSPILNLWFPDQIVKLFIDEFGLLHVVYQEMDTWDAYYMRQDNTGNWTVPRLLGGVYMTDTFANLQIRVDAYDRTHIMWNDNYSQLYYAGSGWAETAETITLTQAITLPITMSTPTLSFLYQVDGLEGNTASHLTIELDNGVTITPLLALTENSRRWQQQTVDVTPWAGQTVSLTFRLEQAASAPLVWFFLDDVSIGAAHSDVWVTTRPTIGLPGEQITQTLIYGNRGGAVSTGTRLTYTLPAELSFVSASIPPLSTSPLVWELGDLPAKSQPSTLSVVVQILPTAVPFTTLTNTAVIHPIDSELETLNNNTQGQTFIGRRLYLPVIKP